MAVSCVSTALPPVDLAGRILFSKSRVDEMKIHHGRIGGSSAREIEAMMFHSWGSRPLDDSRRGVTNVNGPPSDVVRKQS